MQQPDELYREEIGFFWGKLSVAIMLVVSLSLFVLLAIQRTYGQIGDDPAPDLVYILLGGYFLAIGLLLLNFTTLIVSATPRGITAGYGCFRYHIAWENVAGYEVDPRRTTLAYGGYGIHIACKNSQSVLAYNIMGAPTIVLEQKQGRFKYVAFSTRRPDEVMGIIRSYKR